MIQTRRVLLVLLMAAGLGACATPQAMMVNAGAVANPVAKYRGALAVRNVSGGAMMNILTMPGVSDEPFKAALESSLAQVGYLASSGAPRFYVDAEIQNLQQPMVAIDVDVTATVTYKVTPVGGGASASYPVTAKGNAAFGDSLIGADRLRVANERAMQANIKAFLQQLR